MKNLTIKRYGILQKTGEVESITFPTLELAQAQWLVSKHLYPMSYGDSKVIKIEYIEIDETSS